MFVWVLNVHSRDPLALERAARQYRNAASVHEANCTWSGQLPPKQPPGWSYSLFCMQFSTTGVLYSVFKGVNYKNNKNKFLVNLRQQ